MLSRTLLLPSSVDHPILTLLSTLVLPPNVDHLTHSLLLTQSSVVLQLHSLSRTLLPSVVLLTHSLLSTLVLLFSVVRQLPSLLLTTLHLQPCVALLTRDLSSLRPLIIVLPMIRAQRWCLSPITIPFELSLLRPHRAILPNPPYRRRLTPDREALPEWQALDAEASQKRLVPPCSLLHPRLACRGRQQICLLHGFRCRLPHKLQIIIESIHLLWVP